MEFPGGSVVESPLTNAGDTGSVLGLEKSLGGRNSNPLQYSYLESPMARGAWRAAVHAVSRNWTQLS